MDTGRRLIRMDTEEEDDDRIMTKGKEGEKNGWTDEKTTGWLELN